MALFFDCFACQVGQHAEHVATPQPTPEGMLGGCICPCAGDCAERNRQCDGCKHPTHDCICWYIAEIAAGVREDPETGTLRESNPSKCGPSGSAERETPEVSS